MPGKEYRVNFGLILSIVVGVVIGVLILINREWLVVKAKEGPKRLVAGAYAIRKWIIGLILIATVPIVFALSRVEVSYDHWKLNQVIKASMRKACNEKGGEFDAAREIFYCRAPFGAEGEDDFTWKYLRRNCAWVTYEAGEFVGKDIVDNNVICPRS